ncbi:MAG: D-alanyl-D-alanine carboxypeptidase PBP3, partial [Streptococcus sp.]|nr:D-alanyl-D-alanine carboxypeptidase PBP3 [Streptococcus sp.]
MKKIVLFLTVLLSSFLAVSTSADSFDVSAKHAIAIETTTGKILYEKKAEQTAPIASITKLLTIYLVYQEIDQGNLTWETKVPISDYAYNLTTNSEASNVPLEAREYTVKQLVTASLVASANSAAIALAEQIAGSEPQFVDKMRAQLEEWGITDYQIVNASGLNNEVLGDNIYPGTAKDAENRLSAKSLAIIAQHLITEYPDVLSITSKPTAQFAGMTLTSTNYMLKDQPYYREGVDGLKTGTTDAAGQSFVASSTENNMSIITVVLNADNSDSNDFARFVATNELLNYVNLNYEMTTVLGKGKSFKTSQATVVDGKQKTITAVAKEDLKAVQLKHSESKNNLNFSSSSEGYLAPIQQGQVVGKAIFKDDDIVG